MKHIAAVLIGFVFFSCCKVGLDEIDPIIGDWEIMNIDTGKIHNVFMPPEYVKMGSRSDTGTITFYSNHTGEFTSSLTQVFGPENEFVWDFDSTRQYLDFSFSLGTSNGFIIEESADNLGLLFHSYHTHQDATESIWYSISLSKK